MSITIQGTATNEQIRERIQVLCDEIDTNEEENAMMLEEINALYTELNKRRDASC